MVEIDPYQALAELGPEVVAQEAKRRGVGPVETIKIIRGLFKIEFVAAKEIATQVHLDISLAEHQANLIPMLEQVIAELEQEAQADKE